MSKDTIIPSLKTNLVIVADLGLLRAYRVVQGVTDRQPHLELVEELKPENARQKLSEQVTDAAGRFSKGGGTYHVAGNLSVGERHNLELEQTRRLVSLLAGKINALLADDRVEGCWLAASSPIHLQLLDELTAAGRARIYETLALDLTKVPPAALIEKLQPDVTRRRGK